MTLVEGCHRCHRPASNAVAAEGFVVLLCDHHRQLVAALAEDRRVQVGRRVVVLDAPRTEGVRR